MLWVLWINRQRNLVNESIAWCTRASTLRVLVPPFHNVFFCTEPLGKYMPLNFVKLAGIDPIK